LQGIETFLGIVTSVGNSLIFFGEVAYKVGERVGWLVGMKAPQQGVGAGGGGGGGGGWGDDAAVEVADAFGMRMRESLEKVAATIQKSIDNIRDRLADAPEVQADAQIDVEPIFEAMVKSAVDLSRKAASQAQEAFSSIGTRLQESFEQIKRVNEELAPLYKQLSDAEESRIDALSENTRRALEVSDIRSGGIASVIALATGREDPALDEARKQSRRLEEIKAEIRNLGGTVEIAGAA
jgi:regulator of replication initiation timing